MSQVPTEVSAPEPAQSSRRTHAWFALIILFGINAINFYDRQILAAVVEPVRKEWALTDAKIGFLSTAFTLLYAAAGVPLGRLADSWKRTRLLSLGVTFWSLLTSASGLAWSYSALFFTRLGAGVGEASCAPAANSLIGDLYPPNRRARALSIFMLGLPIGIFLSLWLSGRIAHAYGWRTAFYFPCIPGLILGALALLIHEPERGRADVGPRATRRRHGSPYLLVLGTPTMLWIILSGALHNFNMYAVNSFLTAFLSRYHHLPLKDATFTSSIVLGAVGVIGLLAGGWAADRAGKAFAGGRLLVSAFALLIASPCIFFALQQPSGSLGPFVLLMGTGCCFGFMYYSGVYAAIQDVIEPALRGTAMALYFFAMYVLGASFGPLLTGKLSDHLANQAMARAGSTIMSEGFKAVGLHQAMYIIPALSLVLTAVLFAASRTMPRDVDRLRNWMQSSGN
jgi:predicted MFS family arabinose efflux permease